MENVSTKIKFYACPSFMHLRAQGLSEEDELPAYSLHRVWCSLP